MKILYPYWWMMVVQAQQAWQNCSQLNFVRNKFLLIVFFLDFFIGFVYISLIQWYRVCYWAGILPLIAGFYLELVCCVLGNQRFFQLCANAIGNWWETKWRVISDWSHGQKDTDRLFSISLWSNSMQFTTTVLFVLLSRCWAAVVSDSWECDEVFYWVLKCK